MIVGQTFAAANAPVASRFQSGAPGGASLSVFVRQQRCHCMREIKQLPGRRKKVHKVLIYVLVLIAIGLGFLQKHPQSASLIVFVSLIVAFLIVVLVAGAVGRPFRCPHCGKFLREGGDHPRAAETYVYYCKRCDVIWDTLIEKSNV